MLKIRDPEVRVLAQEVMKLRSAPNMTAAIKLSLKNYMEDLDRSALAEPGNKDRPDPDAQNS